MGRHPVAEKRTALPAKDKLAFLLALVPYLIDHDGVSVTAVAKHFGVGERLIRDAVRLIAVSGVPGETSAYQHGDLFDIAWDEFEYNDVIVLTNLVAIDDAPRFSGREAAALIAGLQYLSSLPENADRAAIATLMGKLSRGASTAVSQVAVEGAESDAALGAIRQAVADGVQVEFDYLNARGEHERRRVDPLRVESVDSDWYLRGWCHLREAPRTFRLDRMSELNSTTVPTATHPQDVPLPDSLFQGSPQDISVTVQITNSAVPLLADYIPADAPLTAIGDRQQTTIRVSHLHGLKRLVSEHPGVITVIEPTDAREIVAEWAAAGLAQYGLD
jgi:proteasome accessory factor C